MKLGLASLCLSDITITWENGGIFICMAVACWTCGYSCAYRQAKRALNGALEKSFFAGVRRAREEANQ